MRSTHQSSFSSPVTLAENDVARKDADFSRAVQAEHVARLEMNRKIAEAIAAFEIVAHKKSVAGERLEQAERKLEKLRAEGK